MRRTVTALSALAAVMALCAIVVGCTQAAAAEQYAGPEFDRVHDLYFAERVPSGATRLLQEYEEQQEEIATGEAEPEPEPEYYEEWYEEPYYEDYGAYAPSYSSDGFMSQGVRAGVDSDTETWYSSQTAYHYRTDEWTVDDEGYYRDSDGYYVVASNDYAEGDVVTSSKGEAKVYDSGTESGNLDMYVSW